MLVRTSRGVLVRGAMLASLMLALPARADPASQSYMSTVTGNTVKVCITYSSCGSAMVRESSDGQFATLGGKLNDDGSNCYIDECVPPGTYRYGCEKPLSCACDEPPAFTSATVTAPVAPDCTRSAGDDPPVPLSGLRAPPWTGDQEHVNCCAIEAMCDARPPPPDAGMRDAGSHGDAGSGQDMIVSGCGCSSVGSVFAFDGSVLLVSVALIAGRRRRARPPS